MEVKSIVSPIQDFPSLNLKQNDVGIVETSSHSKSTINFVGLKRIENLDNRYIRLLIPDNYGDKFAEKICNVCHRILPTEKFDLNQNGKGDRPVRRPSCHDCRKDIDGVSMSTGDRKKWKALKPHLTPFECPICQKVTIPGLSSKVVLNHDHVTGKPTGYICDSCNTGLGRFKDNVSILENAIRYLLKFTNQD